MAKPKRNDDEAARPKRNRQKFNPNAWNESILSKRTNVLLLGVSYPCVKSQLRASNLHSDFPLLYPDPSVEQAVELVRRNVLTEMDGRDLARILSLEHVFNDTLAYTVSLENGSKYMNRHLHANFNRKSLAREIKKQWGPSVKFRQIVLDYFWIPSGTWVMTHWTRSLFEFVLPSFVTEGLLLTKPKSTKSEDNWEHQIVCNSESYEPGTNEDDIGPDGMFLDKLSLDGQYSNEEKPMSKSGVVYLPFCMHCISQILGSYDALSKYYAISFVHKHELSEVSLWYGTSLIDSNLMQNWLGKAKNQEDSYCTFDPVKEVKNSFDDSYVTKEELIDLFARIKDIPSVRMIRLEALPKWYWSSNKKSKRQSRNRSAGKGKITGGFIDLMEKPDTSEAERKRCSTSQEKSRSHSSISSTTPPVSDNALSSLSTHQPDCLPGVDSKSNSTYASVLPNSDLSQTSVVSNIIKKSTSVEKTDDWMCGKCSHRNVKLKLRCSKCLCWKNGTKTKKNSNKCQMNDMADSTVTNAPSGIFCSEMNQQIRSPEASPKADLDQVGAATPDYQTSLLPSNPVKDCAIVSHEEVAKKQRKTAEKTALASEVSEEPDVEDTWLCTFCGRMNRKDSSVTRCSSRPCRRARSKSDDTFVRRSKGSDTLLISKKKMNNISAPHKILQQKKGRNKKRVDYTEFNDAEEDLDVVILPKNESIIKLQKKKSKKKKKNSSKKNKLMVKKRKKKSVKYTTDNAMQYTETEHLKGTMVSALSTSHDCSSGTGIGTMSKVRNEGCLANKGKVKLRLSSECDSLDHNEKFSAKGRQQSSMENQHLALDKELIDRKSSTLNPCDRHQYLQEKASNFYCQFAAEQPHMDRPLAIPLNEGGFQPIRCQNQCVYNQREYHHILQTCINCSAQGQFPLPKICCSEGHEKLCQCSTKSDECFDSVDNGDVLHTSKILLLMRKKDCVRKPKKGTIVERDAVMITSHGKKKELFNDVEVPEGKSDQGTDSKSRAHITSKHHDNLPLSEEDEQKSDAKSNVPNQNDPGVGKEPNSFRLDRSQHSSDSSYCVLKKKSVLEDCSATELSLDGNGIIDLNDTKCMIEMKYSYNAQENSIESRPVSPSSVSSDAAKDDSSYCKLGHRIGHSANEDVVLESRGKMKDVQDQTVLKNLNKDHLCKTVGDQSLSDPNTPPSACSRFADQGEYLESHSDVEDKEISAQVKSIEMNLRQSDMEELPDSRLVTATTNNDAKVVMNIEKNTNSHDCLFSSTYEKKCIHRSSILLERVSDISPAISNDELCRENEKEVSDAEEEGIGSSHKSIILPEEKIAKHVKINDIKETEKASRKGKGMIENPRQYSALSMNNLSISEVEVNCDLNTRGATTFTSPMNENMKESNRKSHDLENLSSISSSGIDCINLEDPSSSEDSTYSSTSYGLVNSRNSLPYIAKPSDIALPSGEVGSNCNLSMERAANVAIPQDEKMNGTNDHTLVLDNISNVAPSVIDCIISEYPSSSEDSTSSSTSYDLVNTSKTLPFVAKQSALALSSIKAQERLSASSPAIVKTAFGLDSKGCTKNILNLMSETTGSINDSGAPFKLESSINSSSVVKHRNSKWQYSDTLNGAISMVNKQDNMLSTNLSKDIHSSKRIAVASTPNESANSSFKSVRDSKEKLYHEIPIKRQSKSMSPQKIRPPEPDNLCRVYNNYDTNGGIIRNKNPDSKMYVEKRFDGVMRMPSKTRYNNQTFYNERPTHRSPTRPNQYYKKPYWNEMPPHVRHRNNDYRHSKQTNAPGMMHSDRNNKRRFDYDSLSRGSELRRDPKFRKHDIRKRDYDRNLYVHVSNGSTVNLKRSAGSQNLDMPKIYRAERDECSPRTQHTGPIQQIASNKPPNSKNGSNSLNSFRSRPLQASPERTFRSNMKGDVLSRLDVSSIDSHHSKASGKKHIFTPPGRDEDLNQDACKTKLHPYKHDKRYVPHIPIAPPVGCPLNIDQRAWYNIKNGHRDKDRVKTER
eukprot:CAMPEP_0194440934 /NCGR_PEP_ID=MMETSP0176-20130528/118812_1 /TAXON_ID=216777 /ORGANISM="Proboscia alata, Strain PI-D3" /LENGTH=1988 /DNA_ID=CAMNT_0039265739 /DNA_START=119 /DNA_END=6085 /DNA_ORIENTATION=+